MRHNVRIFFSVLTTSILIAKVILNKENSDEKYERYNGTGDLELF